MTKNLILVFASLLIISHAFADDSDGKGMQTPKSSDAVAASRFSAASAEGVQYYLNFIDGPLIDILWCGDPSDTKQTLFILTDKGTVYSTNDLGKNWNKLRETFLKTGKRNITDVDNIGDITNMLHSPVDVNMVIFLGSFGVNWITEDCGSNIRVIHSGRKIKEFLFHPTERNWVLASSYTTCDEFVDEPCKIYKEVFVSQDLCETWTLLADYVIQFSWGLVDGMYYAPFVPQERVIIAHSLVKEGHQKVRGWTEDAEIVFSDDLFKTKSVVLDRGNKFLVTSNFFFAVQVDDEDIQNVKLYVGNPYRSDLSKLSPIALPGRKQQKKKKDSKLLEHSYTILDTSEEQVFLHINHEGERSKFGNIYISDSTGQRFALSVRNNVRNANGQCDFEKVVGLEGIFLANVYDAKIVEKMKGEFEGDQAISTSQTKAKSNVKATPSTKTADAEGEKGKRLRELDEFKMTLISFDKGGVWKPLTPPKADSKGEAIDCELEEGCSLHLHSFTSSKYGPFYSTESSRGIVIGVGNVGKYLSNKEDEVNTYLSRDGGFSWFEVMKGSHIFEISDHGALIVIAPDQAATTTVYYTWNEGLTWESLQISSTPIHIANIVTELSNIGQHFVVYGRTATSAKEHYRDSKGVIVSLDFGSLHERVCQLPDKPDNPASDYEKWSPNGLISAHCLMGRQTTYIRRKREAECYNPETAEGWVTVKKCECTEEDWECDLGFERKKDGSCEATSNDTISYDPPEDCDGYYYVSQGYRKVAGDSCEGGVTHDPIKLPCRGKGVSKSKVMILFAAVTIAYVMYFFYKNGAVNQMKKIVLRLFDRIKPAFSKSAPSKSGFRIMNENTVPDSYSDTNEDEDEGRFNFGSQKGSADEQSDDKKALEKGRKKMAGRTGLDSAQKEIPMISKPSLTKNSNEELF